MAATTIPMCMTLSRRGFGLSKAQLSKEDIAQLKRELTVLPFVPEDYKTVAPPKPTKHYQESAHTLYVPKFFGLKRFSPPPPSPGGTSGGMEGGACVAPELQFRGSMRAEQKDACEAFLRAASVEGPWGGGGILNLPCGFGKTVIALWLIAKLGCKTLVVVHKDFLLQQWKERMAAFLPGARVGLLKASVVDVEDKDIVLASLQSLSMKSYDAHPQLLEAFGFLVVDECHHTSAEVFSNALKKTCFRYTLGLSATLQRKDGLSRVFKWYLGDVVYKARRSQAEQGSIRVKIREFFQVHDDYSRELYWSGAKLNISAMINRICAFMPRNRALVCELLSILEGEPARRVLVLSDRRDHLHQLAVLLQEAGVKDVGFYYGGVAQEALKQTEACRVILGTFQFVSEGFDVPGLDTLVLASPKSDVIQAVGRILREKPEARKHDPLVFDMVDTFSLFEKQGAKRLKYYQAQRFSIDRVQRLEDAKEVLNNFASGRCCIRDGDAV